jgi:hypothetical protein
MYSFGVERWLITPGQLRARRTRSLGRVCRDLHNARLGGHCAGLPELASYLPFGERFGVYIFRRHANAGYHLGDGRMAVTESVYASVLIFPRRGAWRSLARLF